MISKVLVLLVVSFITLIFGGSAVGNAVDSYRKGDYAAFGMNVVISFLIMASWFSYLVTWCVKFLIL